MKRKKVNFTWENEDAQEVFAEWVPFPDANASARDVDAMESLFDLRPPLAVLDVGCGNGRHAIELAKRGHTVVGIDVARRFLKEAGNAARDADVHVEFRLQRASELPERNVFDFALAYWHTIGFMPEDEIQRHFGAIHGALKPDGVFLYVFQGPRLIPGHEDGDSQPVRNWKEKDGKFILSRKSTQDGVRHEYCVVIDTAAGEITEYMERQKAMAYSDVLDYLAGAGFPNVEAYNDFESSPATAEDFSIFVCRKQ